MKVFQSYIPLALSLLTLACAACDDDKDIFKISELSPTSMMNESGSDIVISADNLSKVVLQMSFDVDGEELYLTNSYSNVTLGDGVYLLQVSTDENFAKNVESKVLSNTMKGSNDLTYTGSDINVLAKSLGLEVDKAQPLYFRVGHGYTADDLNKVVFCEPVKVNVTPVYIDMHYAYVYDKNKAAVLDTLTSVNEDGIYCGFVATAGGWLNFYLRDGMGQDWGNYGVDGNFAKADVTTNGAWNFWTAEPAGCIYMDFNTDTRFITFTCLQTLAVSGDAAAELSFDVQKCMWAGVVKTEKDNASITLQGSTLINDNSTGDAAASAKSGTMYFAVADKNITVSANAAGAISIPAAGSYKLEVDFSKMPYCYRVIPLGNVKVYPIEVYAVVGGEKTALTADIEGGMATGVYRGSVISAIAGAEISFVDGDNNPVGVNGTLANAAEYEVLLEMLPESDNLTLTEITYKLPNSLGLYYDKDYAYIQSVFYPSRATDRNGVFAGFFYKDADDWNFYIKDENNVTYGVDNVSWDQFSFLTNATANFWVTQPQKNYFYTFDQPNKLWNEREVTSICATGDFNGWSLESHLFTDNGDGTWTLKDMVVPADEQWGPYLLINGTREDGSWADEDKIFIAEDGESLQNGKGAMVAGGAAGTYDVTVNLKTNKITVTKK